MLASFKTARQTAGGGAILMERGRASIELYCNNN